MFVYAFLAAADGTAIFRTKNHLEVGSRKQLTRKQSLFLGVCTPLILAG